MRRLVIALPQENEMKLSDFQIIGPLGRGSYGEVILAKSKKKVDEVDQNELVAVKVISKIFHKSIITEINVMKFNPKERYFSFRH